MKRPRPRVRCVILLGIDVNSIPISTSRDSAGVPGSGSDAGLADLLGLPAAGRGRTIARLPIGWPQITGNARLWIPTVVG